MIEQLGHIIDVIRYVQTMEYTANAVHGAKILTPGRSIFGLDPLMLRRQPQREQSTLAKYIINNSVCTN